jgi:two-component system, chemotaxis family, response regulator Rcp1
LTDFESPANILLIEDNPADARLWIEAFKPDGSPPHALTVVNDGEEALDLLFRRARHAAAPRPDLIVLDLRLPGVAGFEVLERIKLDPDLRRIPVVVFSASVAQKGMLAACYERHANCVVVKPAELDDFVAAVRSIRDYWLNTAALPGGCNGSI